MTILKRVVSSGRQTFVPFGISPLFLSFKDKNEESAFAVKWVCDNIYNIRVSFAVAVVLVSVYGFIDPFMCNTHEKLISVFISRYLVLIPISLSLIYCTFRAEMWGRLPALATTTLILKGLFWCVYVYGTNLTTDLVGFPAVIITSLYMFFFSGLLFRVSFPLSLSLNLLFLVSIWNTQIPTLIGLGIMFHLLVILLLLAMAAYQKELVSRQLFASERREREMLTRKRQSDDRYLDWLRSLARFLRHEVRQPVAQINSSLELIKVSAQDHSLETYVADASAGVQNVWNLIERASRATDLEAFIRQDQVGRVDLEAFLAGLLTRFRRTYSGVAFALQSTQPSVVRADPMLLDEAVENLVRNAASFADHGSVIQIDLAGDEQSAFIRVRNRGPQIDGDPDALFRPFRTSRADYGSEHEGLGLYLVRLIAEHYGGTATIRNLDDGSGVEASLFLPTEDASAYDLLGADQSGSSAEVFGTLAAEGSGQQYWDTAA